MGLFPARSALVLAGVIAITGTLAAGPAPNANATPATTGDFSGLVDIGGRSLYLECRSQGSPTVILEAGANGRGDVWSRDNQQPAGQRTMVLPGVAAFSIQRRRYTWCVWVMKDVAVRNKGLCWRQ